MLNDYTPLPRGYQQLLVKGGEHIALPEKIATPINERVMTGNPGKIMGKYEEYINQPGKAGMLGGGLFHGYNTIGTFTGQQLMSGNVIKNPAALGNVLKNAFSDKSFNTYMENMKQEPSGGVDTNHSVLDGANASALNIKNTSIDIANPEDTSLAGKIIRIPGLKQIHDAVFKREIPTMMLETFRQKTSGLDIFGNADDRLQAEKIARGINKEFGVTDHDLAGMTTRQFRALTHVALAPGYQEGVIATFLKAFNPRSIGTAEGTLAREAVFGKALVMGGLATLGSVAGGDFQGQSPKQVAMGIMNKAINPSFNIAGYKVSTPATFISDVAKPVEESIASAKNGKGIAAGVEDFARSHLAFAPSKIEEFATNKNYEGNAIYGSDYYGRPIPASNVATNLASGVLPIPLAQTSQAITGAQSWQAALANEVGFNANPSSNLNYAPVAAQTYLQQLEKTPGVSKAQLDADTQFVSALGAGDTGRSKVLKQATALLAQAEKSNNTQAITQNQSKVTQIIDTYNKKLIQALKPWQQSGGEAYLDANMLNLLRTTMISFKNANSNVTYDISTNPTSVGIPIAALANAPQPVNN